MSSDSRGHPSQILIRKKLCIVVYGLGDKPKFEAIVAEVEAELAGVRAQLFEEQKKVVEDVSAETSRRQALEYGVAETMAARRADALERVVAGFLASRGSEHSGGDRYLINIHTDMDTLKADGEGSEAELEDRGHVSAATSLPSPRPTGTTGWISPHKHRSRHGTAR